MGHATTSNAPEDKPKYHHNVTKSNRLVSSVVVEGGLSEYESMELHTHLYDYKISKNKIIAYPKGVYTPP